MAPHQRLSAASSAAVAAASVALLALVAPGAVRVALATAARAGGGQCPSPFDSASPSSACALATGCPTDADAYSDAASSFIEGSFVDEDLDEEEVLKVSLLQTNLKLGASREAQLHSDASAAGAAATTSGDYPAASEALKASPAAAAAPAAPAAPAAAPSSLRVPPPAALGGASPDSDADGEEAADGAAFLQTELDLSPGAGAASHADHDGSDAQVDATIAQGQRAWPVGAEGALGLAPLHLRLQLNTLAAAGAVPQSSSHVAAAEAGRLAALEASASVWKEAEAPPRAGASPARAELSLLQPSLAEHLVFGGLAGSEGAGGSFTGRPSSSTEMSILLLYMSFYVLSMFFMFTHLKPPQTIEKTVDDDVFCTPGSMSPPARVVSEIDIEEEEYRKSGIGWLRVSWASAWVAQWGNTFQAALQKMKARDLPQLGMREWQAQSSGERIERLWAEEIHTKGKAGASLGSIVPRLWTRPVMAYMLFIQACRMFVCQLYVVILIEHSLHYFYWLQGYVNTHGDLPNMVVPMLVTIAAFTSLPLLNVLFMSIGSALSNRLDQQLLGGVAVALFKKAQRLPAGGLGPSGGSGVSAPNVPETTNGNGAPPEDAGPSAPLDLMTLINYDVGQQLLGCFEHVCSCLNSLIAFIILMTMLWMRLKVATLVVLACAIPTVIATVVRGAGLATNMMEYQEKVDKRVTALREVVFGIRVVKCYAWEDAMERRIGNFRAQEVSSLSKWYHSLGVMYGIVLCFPRMLVFAGLWGYSVIYGHQDVVTIFTCMVILGSLRSMCEIFAASLGRVVSFLPTIKRIDTYLKLPEAPLIAPNKIPSWVRLDSAPSTSEQTNEKKDALSLHGSFKWRPDAATALHDLTLDIRQGELVAVMGEVGAGKSTLLHAVLGELFPASPTADASSADAAEGSAEAVGKGGPWLARPAEVAFCPQVAHIAEGTIRDNIVFGLEFDEQRYRQALHCASLESDLQVLAGGDSALVGARGISLSGGQKARVAMARAAYRASASLVLFDDPFGAVDAPTAKFLLEELLAGPLLQDRTRFVVMQPDAERLQRFDRAIVLERGRVKEQGSPEEVMKSEAYQRLLSSSSSNFSSDASSTSSNSPGSKATTSQKKKKEEEMMNAVVAQALREDEHEGRPTWSMVKQYCRLGRWRNLINCLLIFIMQTFIFLICDLVLVHWTNAMSINMYAPDKPYLFGYLFWLTSAFCVWFVGWNFGTWFTLRISGNIHNMALHRILRAPVDMFFDKHPVGRIMNRLHNDVVVIDTSLFLRFFGSFAAVVQTIIPMLYIHTIMPWFLSLAALPIYYLIAAFVSRAWNTLVLMLYCMFSAKSFVAARAGDVSSSNVVLRGLQDLDRISSEFADALNDANTVDLTCRRVLKRWLVNRVHFLWSFYTTTTFLVGMLNAQYIGAGTLGLCLTNLLILEVLLEPNIENSTGALYEFICLARVHEYLSVPQEEPMQVLADERYRSFTAKVPRSALRALSAGPSAPSPLAPAAPSSAPAPPSSGGAGAGGAPGGSAPEVLLNGGRFLVPSPDGRSLLLAASVDTAEPPSPSAPPRRLLGALCPSCPELAEAQEWHRIVAVNDIVGDAAAMARELTKPIVYRRPSDSDEKDEVLLDVRSGWLADGAKVELRDLRAGYADIPRDVLKGITLTFEERSKVAIAGTTGCGKSSLLLVLLRILEPRGGCVLLNGMDTRELGLATLRAALGLVPQDPVLFSGSLRENLDPFGDYSDGRILNALGCVRLADLVRSWPEGLSFNITDEGGNLSFGQRQLVCLARMILRQPSLLLLDEATSAIDPYTQECVQSAIDREFANSTLLAVAHRLETVLKFDYAVVLDKGEVAEHGMVSELKERRGGVLRTMLETKSTW